MVTKEIRRLKPIVESTGEDIWHSRERERELRAVMIVDYGAKNEGRNDGFSIESSRCRV